MPLFLPHLCPYTTAACAVAATDVVDVVVNLLSWSRFRGVVGEFLCSLFLTPATLRLYRWQGRLYPSPRPFLSTNLQLTSASDSPPVCTP